MVGHVGIFGEREKAGHFGHVFAGGLAHRFGENHFVRFEIGAELLIGIIAGLFVAPGRQIEDKRAIPDGPVAGVDVSDVAVRAGCEGILEQTEPVRRAAPFGEIFANRPAIGVILFAAGFASRELAAQILENRQLPCASDSDRQIPG